MRQPERVFLSTMLLAGVVGQMAIASADAQALWKYTDKDGKVTYSDKAPKKGEAAQLVTSDPSANVLDAPKNIGEGSKPTAQDAKARADRERNNEKLREALNTAKADLDAARSALESGRDPLPSEVQIVVGRTNKGVPTGVNSSLRKPEYAERIAALEEAVKRAEEKVEIADANFRRGPSDAGR